MRDEATQRQVDAANPARSTWLAANAGSGKTRVLTNRVAHLLYSGVRPQNILCLTYTKAAATEMQNRLFAQLGAWTLLPNAALVAELRDLGIEGSLGGDALANARRLFANALETPGGLRIQTIHSFCAAVLRRFPLEAGISPQFQEMEDRAAKQLQLDVLETLAAGQHAYLVDGLAQWHSGHEIEKLLSEILRNKTLFQRKTHESALSTALGSPSTDREILDALFVDGDADALAALCPMLEASGRNDQKLARALRRVDVANPSLSMLATLEGRLLTGKDANAPFTSKAGKVPTKSLREGAASAYVGALDRLSDRVERLRPARLAKGAAERSLALLRFGETFVAHYEASKAALGWLDFDDLIEKTRALLSERALAQWVLFRLDGGIDHILVDEAQDTSPRQWDVIWRLAEEFTTGEGARQTERTVFVVGDQKQSIYSFQGADPAEFDRMRHRFSQALDQIGDPLQDMALNHSFRSSWAVLETVDATFSTHKDALGDAAAHLAFKSELPGRVDLWPVVEPREVEADEDWEKPVDRQSPEMHGPKLARAVASEIRAMIGDARGKGAKVRPDPNAPGGWCAIEPKDILILLPRRSDLFHEIIRACKQQGIPMAGSDRVVVGAELAVRDILSALRFLTLAEDDLSLAEALRSPLFGWSEKMLYDLAQDRAGHLWEALRKSDAHPETRDILDDLRRSAEFLRPYELIERILTRHGGRKKLLARLGHEAEEGIDVLLTQALAYETSAVPSLTGFVGWMDADDVEIKRTIDAARNEVRVMTVHGSKGLEAPIVFLPDTSKRKPPTPPDVLETDGLPVWRPQTDALTQQIEEMVRERQSVAARERQRLLYVAMTRAETWLIVCGAGEVGKTPEDSWYLQVRDAMHRLGADAIDTPTGPGLRVARHAWSEDVGAADTPETGQTALPSWALAKPVGPTPVPPAFSPSQFEGPKALPGESLPEDEALARGTAIHLLLERLPGLPEDAWPGAAARLVDPLPPDILAEVTQVLKKPELSFIFSDASLAEVDLSADLAGGRAQGTIDRLLVTEDRVTAIDFKSNAIVPTREDDVPKALLAQMGAYAHMLHQIYPDHEIETALLWTRNATLMRLSSGRINAAMQALLPA